jgi:acetoacetyl-[acyl-carrier protein] synthase
MKPLPVIVGLGGINPAGRVSFHHAYRRMVIDALDAERQEQTYRSLGQLMQLKASTDDADTRDYIRAHTLIRSIELFDPNAVHVQKAARLQGAQDGQPMEFLLRKRQMPAHIPDHWQLEDADDRHVRVRTEHLETLLPDRQVSRVGAAGQVPTGFNPGDLYPSRNHPRGLQLTVVGASDALRSTGIDLETLKNAVRPDEFAVYSGSAMGQLDGDGYGGLFQNSLKGRRPTSKNVPLGLPEMPGDFVNAYVLGALGGTAGIIGACSTFLYTVRHGIADITSGRKRVVVVGNAEAAVVPEVIEGYRTMGALAEDEALMALDNSDVADHRRACRPFSDNCGFTISESAVFAVLMDDALAIELGARVLGSVGGVFVNADGYKKSIPGPGVGNYVTVGKAMALARAIIGEEGLRRRTHMQAHGTGTPQNRVTESHILNEMARTNGIESWPVAAIKAYVGHSLAPAGGDQLAAALGSLTEGWLPGITTIDHIADDVHHSHLELPLAHKELDPEQQDGAFINSKGFGGNNATGFILSPRMTEQMLSKRWGAKAMAEYRGTNERVAEAAANYDQHADDGSVSPIYRFGEGVLDGEDLKISQSALGVPGFAKPISLDLENPFSDMTES